MHNEYVCAHTLYTHKHKSINNNNYLFKKKKLM